MKRFLALLVVGLAVAGSSRAGFAAAPAGTPYELNAVLPLTGPGAFLGKSFSDTLRAVEYEVNRTGGIAGRPLKFTVSDSTSNPQTSLQLMNALIAKRVPVLIDGGPSFVCNATIPVVAKTGPVDYCLSPVIHPEGGSYVFTASVGTNDFADILIRYYRLRGWTRIGLITGTDATGQDFDTQMVRVLALPENRAVRLVAHEHFNPSDISVSAQIARIKAAGPQALIAWTTGTPFGMVLHGINDAGIALPVATATSNQNFSQMEQYAGFLPAEVYFPSVRAVTLQGTGKGPVRDRQLRYYAAFKAIGVRPDYVTNIPWDPLMIIVEALRARGPNATAEDVRTWIEALHSWPGINGIYDFRANDQRGIGQNAANMQRWDAKLGDFVAVSGPRGYPTPTRAARLDR